MKTKNKKLTFGIIGYGRFGRMWAKYLTKHGKVFVYDSFIFKFNLIFFTILFFSIFSDKQYMNFWNVFMKFSF